MANLVLLAAQRKAAQFEAAGLNAQAKRAKKRVKELEEAEALKSGVSDQSVDDVLAQVGDDPELAAAALEAENAKDKPRKTLVSGLESVIAAAQEPEED